MKKRVLLVSFLTIALCFSLIFGATYALFTSESSVNIAVTSGKVELVAEVQDIQTWSLEDDYAVAGRTDGSFTMGGNVLYANGELALNKVVPGDKVSFKVTGTNNGNVTSLYRVVVKAPKVYALMSGLEVTINGETYTSLLSYATEWKVLEAGKNMDEVEVSVTLPATAGNEFQDLTAGLVVTVEAVQGNAEMTDKAEVITFDYKFAAGETEVNVEYVDTKEELVSVLTGASTYSLKANPAVYAVLSSDLALDADETITVPAGRKVVLDLNGKTIAGESDQSGSNRNMFDVRGQLEVINGSLVYQHVGANMGWNSSTNIFNITAGGVVVLENVVAKNLGGSDMAFVAHLNNWGEVTLVVNNSELLSTYVAVRVFNSGYDMNNVTITNSTLVGVSSSFWVHNYTVADFGTQEKADAAMARLNFNFIYDVADPAKENNLNEAANNSFVGKIRFGFTNSVSYATTTVKVANTIEDIRTQLNDSTVDQIVMLEDVTADAAKGGYSVAGAVVKGQVLDGQGNTLTINNANDTYGCVVYTTGGTIKNVTIKGAFRGIFSAGTSSDIIIDNVVFEDVVYTFNSDAANKDYSVIVTNSVLNGWTSYTGSYKSVSFENCEFGEGSGYAFMRPYSATTMTNCNFEEGFEFDATKTTTTLVNCYYNGQLITDANKVEFLGSGAANLVINNK